MLMDDKTYPYVMVTVSEDYPRIVLARSMKKDGNKYFGPFTSGMAVKDTIELLQKMFKIRNCRKSIVVKEEKSMESEKKEVFSEEQKKEAPTVNGRPCLYYHMGRCDGACQGYISKDEYGENITKAVRFLEGNFKETIKELEQKMQDASAQMDF